MAANLPSGEIATAVTLLVCPVRVAVGVVLPSFRAIDAGLRELLGPANFARFRANAAAIMNRAVFEIPEILETLLQPERRPVQSLLPPEKAAN